MNASRNGGRNQGNRSRKPRKGRPRVKGVVRERTEFSQLNKLVVPRGLRSKGPVPQRRREKLTFNYNYFFGTGANAYGVYDLKLNCLVCDPTLTIGPNGVGAILGVVYQQYHVDHINFLPSKIANNTPGSPVNCYIVMSDQQPSTYITSYSLAQNTGGFSYVTPVVQVGETTGNSKAVIPAVRKVNPGTILGNPMQYETNLEFSGTSAANPTQTLWFGLVLYNITSGTVGTSVMFNITVEFIVDFFSIASTSLALCDERFYESMRPKSVLTRHH